MHRVPLRDLCAMLCLLPKTADPRIDFAEADPDLLLALPPQLDLTVDCLHQGIAGLGALLACVPLDDAGDAVAPQQSIACVGALLGDLGHVLLYISELSSACRPHLADYAPRTGLIRSASRRQSRTIYEDSISIMKSPSLHASTASRSKDFKARSVPASAAASLTAEHYMDAARSAATKKAYAADLAHFLANGGKLPATPQQLSAYLAKLAATLAVATIERRLIGIHRAHQDRNLTSPAVHLSVRQTMQGIRRSLGTVQQRVRAIVKDDLLNLLVLVDQQKPMKAARDRALLLVGFAGAFRRSELVAIRCEDITVFHEGIEIFLQRSKTDQQGAGRTVFIPRSIGVRCPVAALDHWKALAGIESGYVFRRVTRHDTVGKTALTGQTVALVVKAAYRLAGCNDNLVAGHSLRAGYVTTAAMAGLQPFQIRQ